jgi:hypothetical protein
VSIQALIKSRKIPETGLILSMDKEFSEVLLVPDPILKMVNLEEF